MIVGDDNYIVEGQRADFGYVGDMGEPPNTLKDLVVDPYPQVHDTLKGWRGPYVQPTFQESPEGYRMDGWGDTVTYGRERYNNPDSLFVRSHAGYGLSDRTKWITRSFRYTRAELLSNEVQGQILDVFGAAPADTLLGRLQVELKYPRLGEFRWYYALPQSQGHREIHSELPFGKLARPQDNDISIWRAAGQTVPAIEGRSIDARQRLIASQNHLLLIRLEDELELDDIGTIPFFLLQPLYRM